MDDNASFHVTFHFLIKNLMSSDMFTLGKKSDAFNASFCDQHMILFFTVHVRLSICEPDQRISLLDSSALSYEFTSSVWLALRKPVSSKGSKVVNLQYVSQ